jgi:hypothetical protein
MSDFAIEKELLKKNYHNIGGVNIDLFFPGCRLEPNNKFSALLAKKIYYLRLLSSFAGLGQHKEYPTKKHKNVLLLSGVTFFHRKSS